MARRLHSSTLGGSRKWAALASDSHRMLYERLIDITDAYGRFDADPVMVKSQAIPRLATSIGEVEAALDDMEQVGLIERWEVDGNPYACIVAFEKFNNLDPAKEAQTTIPGPDGVVPPRPKRNDRGKPSANPRRGAGQTRNDAGQTQGAPRATTQMRDANAHAQAASPSRADVDHTGRTQSPKPPQSQGVQQAASPGPDGTPASGQDLGKPRAEDGSELGTLYGYGYGYEELNPPTPLRGQGSKPESKNPPSFDPRDTPLPPTVPREVWENFVQHRIEKKKPLTPTATRTLLKRLATIPDAAERITLAISNGWQGVIFPGDRDRPPTTPDAPPRPPRHERPLAESDIVENTRTGEMGHITALLDGDRVRINTGQIWDVAEVNRCSN